MPLSARKIDIGIPTRLVSRFVGRRPLSERIGHGVGASGRIVDQATLPSLYSDRSSFQCSKSPVTIAQTRAASPIPRSPTPNRRALRAGTRAQYHRFSARGGQCGVV
jgi:hypothetical protein